MTISTGNFAELLWPGILGLYGDNYKDWEPLYEKVLSVQDSNKAFEKIQGVTGLPLASIKTQGSPISMVDPYQGFQKEFVNVTYALGTSVTREMVEDEQYSYINKLPRMLARSMRQTEETVAFNLLNNGFGSQNTADGVTIFNTGHPLVGGGTLSNRPAVASDLSQTALEQADIDILGFVDDQSLKTKFMGKTLVVPVALKHTAMKILQTRQTVDSADNTVNTVAGSMNLVVSPYLTDTDAWFIITDADDGLVFMRRRAAALDRDNEFTTQNLAMISTARFSVGAVDPRGAYGSPGA